MKARAAIFRVGLAAGLTAATVGAAVSSASPGNERSAAGNGLVVHEWGTFLTMQGSDGVTLDGMYHEEHALPPFVHARSRDQLRLPSVLTKGETPVIYFYTGREQTVLLEVKFPQGIWTQWYPQTFTIGPNLDATLPSSLRDGHLEWNAVVVPPKPELASKLPSVEKDSLWRYSREVDAAYVRSIDRQPQGNREEYERFLFYRGLGTAPLPLQWRESAGGTLSVRPGDSGAKHLFVLRVEKGKAVYRYLPEIKPGQEIANLIPPMTGAQPMAEFSGKIADDLAVRLTESGLYEKEARAMVNTWKSSYFGTDGIRVLYVLPQEWTDRFIPMDVSPRPKELVRVMVGRLELLTPEREQRASGAVRDLASPDARVRERAFEALRQQGRFVEPILRRVVRTSTDEKVRTLCRNLLLTDFVTELRAAVHSAKDGRVRRDGELHMRAQLASLLKEIGLGAEAREEGERVLSQLRTRPEPSMQASGSRHFFRAFARASEAAGSPAETAAAYGKFIQFASNTAKCGACHETEGPRTMAWYKDWWAGRKYAQYAKAAGLLSQAIAQNEGVSSSSPRATEAQMKLGYLYEAKGDAQKASAMWAQVTGSSRQARVGNGR